eukprot:95967-Amphidinium_carterae.1
MLLRPELAAKFRCSFLTTEGCLQLCHTHLLKPHSRHSKMHRHGAHHTHGWHAHRLNSIAASFLSKAAFTPLATSAKGRAADPQTHNG